MKRLIVASLVLVLVGLGIPVTVGAAGQQPNGVVSGVVRGSTQQPVASSPVRLRNLTTGQVAGTSTTNAQGAFTFSGVPQGNYVVEVLNASGAVVGTSSTLALTATTATVTGVAITLAGAKAAVAPAAAAGGTGSLFTSTAGIVAIAALGAGIGVAVYEGRKSPSK
jgi:hypothetical protein